MDLLTIIIALGAVGLGWILRQVLRERTKTTAPPRPPEPEHTANQHDQESEDATIDAVEHSAGVHDVRPDVVADDLDWLDAGRDDL